MQWKFSKKLKFKILSLCKLIPSFSSELKNWKISSQQWIILLFYENTLEKKLFSNDETRIKKMKGKILIIMMTKMMMIIIMVERL